MQVRAVMIGTHNMCEETLFENELFRREMERGRCGIDMDYPRMGPAVESGFGKPGSLLADVGRFGGDQRIW